VKKKCKKKNKMTQQKDNNLAQVQAQSSVYFCLKIIFKSWFFWLIWPFECLILMILTMTKYHEYLLRDSPLPSLSIVIFFTSLETKMIQKILNETFLRITRYLFISLYCFNFYYICYEEYICTNMNWFSFLVQKSSVLVTEPGCVPPRSASPSLLSLPSVPSPFPTPHNTPITSLLSATF